MSCGTESRASAIPKRLGNNAREIAEFGIFPQPDRSPSAALFVH
jgi:hypothetical protein